MAKSKYPDLAVEMPKKKKKAAKPVKKDMKPSKSKKGC